MSNAQSSNGVQTIFSDVDEGSFDGDGSQNMDLLRFSTAGSVDDGKSTLIGRLLYDTKSIFEDRYDDLRRAGTPGDDEEGEIDFALLTDGLRAEREQGITIDVAYRYFATPRRKFIIADTPGHEQYTRNMVTGASTAELAVVLVDARKGVVTQSRRHGFIASLLQIPHMVLAINKMDLVDYSEEAYEEISREFRAFAGKLDIDDITIIPISALKGDNVVVKGDNMPWYDGPTLLHYLENVKVNAGRNIVDFRFPVQHVIRPHQDFRGFAGEVISGTVAVGEEVTVLPSGKTTRIKTISAFEKELEEATTGDAVVLALEDEIDVSRGNMIVRSRNVPLVESRLDADICWMSGEGLRPNRPYVIQHTTHQTQAFISKVIYRINVDTLHREPADTFKLNDIGRVEITATQPLFFDRYKINRRTGSFILIDPDTNNTVAAGMIRGVAQDATPVGEDAPAEKTEQKSPHVVWEGLNIDRAEREARNGHKAAVVWLTGLSGSGKSTVARVVEKKLFEEEGCQTMLLDGDYVRHGLCSDLGFSPSDRRENIRRIGEVTRLFFEQGSLTLCTFVSPYRENRASVRSLIPEGRFFEVHVDCDLEVCKERDPKGLYQKAMNGTIPNFTGVSAPYEPPADPELVLYTHQQTVEESAQELIAMLKEHGIVR